MSMVFLLLLVLTALALQVRIAGKSFEKLSADYSADRNVVNPEERFTVELSVRNHGRRRISYLKAEVFFDRGFCLCGKNGEICGDAERGGTLFSESVRLKGGQTVRIPIPVQVKERGRYVLPHPELAVGDFLGVRERKMTLSGYRELIVAPGELPSAEILPALGGFLGELSVSRFLFEDPLMTVGIREYTGQEPMKKISWAQSARRGTWMVKEYDHTAEPTVCVLLDMDTAVLPWEISELCFSAARTVCSFLEEQRIPYQFRTDAAMDGAVSTLCGIAQGIGEAHHEAVLECLGRASARAAFSREALQKAAAAGNQQDFQTVPGAIIVLPDETYRSGWESWERQERAQGRMILFLFASAWLRKADD